MLFLYLVKFQYPLHLYRMLANLENRAMGETDPLQRDVHKMQLDMIRADWAELTRNEILRVVVTLTALVNILSYGVTKANHHFTGSKEK